MKTVNFIAECWSVFRQIESMMTAEEQVELMRLEDEVAQARDDLYFAEMDRQLYTHDSVGTCKNVLDRTINNLNNYIDKVTVAVMAREFPKLFGG